MTSFLIVFLGKVRCDPALQTSYFFSPCLTAGNPRFVIESEPASLCFDANGNLSLDLDK
jgi:hypothetical protein